MILSMYSWSPLMYISYWRASTGVCSGSILDEPPLLRKNALN
jgi:hypothetical protein